MSNCETTIRETSVLGTNYDDMRSVNNYKYR